MSFFKLETRSSSYSGLDLSIQAKKQAQKSHVTVPLNSLIFPHKKHDWFPRGSSGESHDDF